MAMRHQALYVCTTDPRRTKRFPFAAGQQPPTAITDAGTGDVFALTLVLWDVAGPMTPAAA